MKKLFLFSFHVPSNNDSKQEKIYHIDEVGNREKKMCVCLRYMIQLRWFKIPSDIEIIERLNPLLLVLEKMNCNCVWP